MDCFFPVELIDLPIIRPTTGFPPKTLNELAMAKPPYLLHEFSVVMRRSAKDRRQHVSPQKTQGLQWGMGAKFNIGRSAYLSD